mmetsp:Transcript_24232/g.37357  ORF Transcript_24232/g.37357 Transcript_24232/m.37357 type:complete len:94 (+) Transcript_24232:502-783(+)
MFHRQIKTCNTINLVVVGVICLFLLIYYRLNDGAHFCTGSHLSDEVRSAGSPNFLVRRGEFLFMYTTIVLTLALTFICVVGTACLYNLKKMGF